MQLYIYIPSKARERKLKIYFLSSRGISWLKKNHQTWHHFEVDLRKLLSIYILVVCVECLQLMPDNEREVGDDGI